MLSWPRCGRSSRATLNQYGTTAPARTSRGVRRLRVRQTVAMLRIGLTGGIGAGKSTVSSTFSELGGIVVDGDVISREVVATRHRGAGRAGRGVRVGDPAARRRAEPAGPGGRRLPRRREAGDAERDRASAGRQAARRADRGGPSRRRDRRGHSAAGGVADGADVPAGDHRPRRPRGSSRATDRAPRLHRGRRPRPHRRPGHRGAAPRGGRRVARQLGHRRRTWPRPPATLWHDRIVPFAHNVQAGEPAPRAAAVGARRPDVAGPGRAASSTGSDTTCGHRAIRVDHVGSTAVPGSGRQGRHRRSGHRRVVGRRRRAGRRAAGGRLPARCDGHRPSDVAHTDDVASWHKRFHASADPGPADERASARRRLAESAVRAAVPRLAESPTRTCGRSTWPSSAPWPPRGTRRRGDYADAKEPWFVDAYRRAWAWADATGWQP